LYQSICFTLAENCKRLLAFAVILVAIVRKNRSIA